MKLVHTGSQQALAAQMARLQMMQAMKQQQQQQQQLAAPIAQQATSQGGPAPTSEQTTKFMEVGSRNVRRIERMISPVQFVYVAGYCGSAAGYGGRP